MAPEFGHTDDQGQRGAGTDALNGWNQIETSGKIRMGGPCGKRGFEALIAPPATLDRLDERLIYVSDRERCRAPQKG